MLRTQIEFSIFLLLIEISNNLVLKIIKLVVFVIVWAKKRKEYFWDLKFVAVAIIFLVFTMAKYHLCNVQQICILKLFISKLWCGHFGGNWLSRSRIMKTVDECYVWCKGFVKLLLQIIKELCWFIVVFLTFSVLLMLLECHNVWKGQVMLTKLCRLLREGCELWFVSINIVLF